MQAHDSFATAVCTRERTREHARDARYVYNDSNPFGQHHKKTLTSRRPKSDWLKGRTIFCQKQQQL